MSELQEEVLSGYPDETFVTYQNCRIFYKLKARYNEWFAIVYLTGKEAAKPGVSTLGCDWFKSKDDAIEWGRDIVDTFRLDHPVSISVREPN